MTRKNINNSIKEICTSKYKKYIFNTDFSNIDGYSIHINVYDESNRYIDSVMVEYSEIKEQTIKSKLLKYQLIVNELNKGCI